MKYFAFIFLMSLGMATFACGPHKPAYEDIKLANRSEAQPAPATDENPAAKVAQEVQAQQPQKAQIPDFMDMKTGQIKDLPSYPKAHMTNSQIGIINNLPIAILLYQASGTFEEAVNFYEQTIKKNGWSVVSNTKASNNYEWELKKGERAQATIKIAQDSPQSLIVISVNRNDAPDAAK